MKELHLDLETYCEVPITNGTYTYAMAAKIILWLWAIDDGEEQVWELDTPMPELLAKAFYDKNVVVIIHNSMFDRNVLRFNKYPLSTERIFDTMVCALCHALPGSLDTLGQIFGLSVDEAKDKHGKALIQLFCKPHDVTHYKKDSQGKKVVDYIEKNVQYTKHSHPEEWQEFIAYGKRDITAMRIIYKKLPKLNYGFGTATARREHALWCLDQRINDRGLCIDMDLATSAIRATNIAQKDNKKRVSELSLGFVASATKRDQLISFILNAYGIELPDLQSSTIERRLEDPILPWAVKELLRVRLQACKTSTSKYKKIINGCVKIEGTWRFCGSLMFSGAGRTQRWAGRGFQGQNLPRPTMIAADIAFAIEAMKTDALTLFHEDVMEVASNAIRGLIIAPPGKKLVVSDLKAIEGRGGAWIAGEQWVLDAYYNEDVNGGADMYEHTYAMVFGIPVEEVTKEQRFLGKVLNLSMGYGGGVGGFVSFALLYNTDIDAMADKMFPTLPDDLLEEAMKFYKWSIANKKTYNLREKTFIVCDVLKRLWRRANPNYVEMWANLDTAVRDVLDDGATRKVRALTISKFKSWLLVQVPSGGYLCYPQMELKQRTKIVEKESGGILFQVTEEETGRPSLSYMGINQYTRQWSRNWTWGARVYQNSVQKFARDVLAWNLPAIEAAGFNPVSLIHDETINEADEDKTHEQLSALLAACPPWAKGLPLAADGFEALRYRKG